MNVAYHCTDDYAHITATSILSVFENNKHMSEINVYVVGNGFTENTVKLFRELGARYGRRVECILMPDFKEELGLGIVGIKEKWLPDSYVRLFLDSLVPRSVDRILYLDGDVLCVRPLDGLWEANLFGRCCAGVADCVPPSYLDLFEMSPQSSYCNSGVILFDLSRWRDTGMGNRVREYVNERNGYVFFMEQTAFNVVTQDSIVYLDPSYNVTTTLQSLGYDGMVKIRHPVNYYGREEIEAALASPILVHMTSFFYVTNRAWNVVTDHPSKELYLKYAKMLGWPRPLLADDQRTFAERAKDRVVHVIPKLLLFPFVSWLYGSVRVRRIKKAMKAHGARDVQARDFSDSQREKTDDAGVGAIVADSVSAV